MSNLVKNTSTNRNIAMMFDLINTDKQAIIIRQRNLYMINKSAIKPTDTIVTNLSQITWG